MNQDNPVPKPGESFHCSACGRDSIAKAQKTMDGWRCTGELIVCAFCKAPVGQPKADATGAAAKAAAGAAALNRLADLLDAKPTAAPQFADTTKGRFCKDCRHFLRHPFYSRCLLHERPVEPMDDCDDFSARPSDGTAAQPQSGDAVVPQ